MRTNDSERIPSVVFMVVNGTLFGLALLMATARLVIRLHSQRKLHPEDFVLIFACSTFIASQVVLYTLNMDNIYWQGALNFDPSPQILASIIEDPEAFLRRDLKAQRMQFSIVVLTWTSIFAVKICFLLFFHQMITRLRRLVLAWRMIFGITIIFWAFCTCAVFISCPNFSQASLKCSQGRGFTRTLALGITEAVLDITSDLLLISIPLILLWEIQIKRQQKIFLGIFLCLSVCMIIIAIVRISSFIIKKRVDLVWVLFWHQVEGAVAIIAVSITAFRSLLGIKALKALEKKKMERSWFSYRPKLLARYLKKTRQDESESEQLPSIPGATLTGMRTFIHGNGIWDESKAMGMTQKSEKDWPGAASHKPQEIEVTHQFSTELDILDRAKSARTASFN